MFEFLSKLTFSKGVSISFMAFGSTIAPYWYLYQFYPKMVKSENVFQSVILCLAISLPIILIFTLIEIIKAYKSGITGMIRQEGINLTKEDVKRNENEVFKYIGHSSLSVGLGFYLTCIIEYFVHEELNGRILMLTISIFSAQLLVELTELVFMKNHSIKKTRDNKK